MFASWKKILTNADPTTAWNEIGLRHLGAGTILGGGLSLATSMLFDKSTKLFFLFETGGLDDIFEKMVGISTASSIYDSLIFVYEILEVLAFPFVIFFTVCAVEFGFVLIVAQSLL